MSQGMLEWGITVILWLQSWGDWLVGPMNFFTSLGYIEFYLLILPAIYWCWNKDLGVRVGTILLLSIGLNEILKVAFLDPRPYWLDPRVRLWAAPEPAFGLPSGHAQHAVVLWGLLASYIQMGWSWVSAVALIFLIGFSRIFLGLHFPTDVLVGWAIGVLILVLFLRFEDPVKARVKRFSETQQIVILFAGSVLIILAGVLVNRIFSVSWQLPAEWVEIALVQAPNEPIMPFSINTLVISASAFFGLTAGAIVLNNRGGFNPQDLWSRRLGRYLVGIVVVVILWVGLGRLFQFVAADETLLGYGLRYIRYGLIGVWVTALGPLVFMQWGLADEA